MPVRLPPRLGEIADALHQLAMGRSNAVGEFTCATSADTTTVSDRAIQVGDTLLVSPTTANAASEVPFLYITPATTAGQVTVTHSNSALEGRTFKYRVTET